jgi:hypothetical protein
MPTIFGGAFTGRAAAAALLLMALASPPQAHAANGAVAVDDTDVDPVGKCKVDSWASFASNRDRLGVVSPGCVFDFGRPVDITFGFVRGRTDGEWESAATVKLRTLIVPGGVGQWSLLFSAAAAYNITTNELADVLINIPATFQVVENFKINLNAGWLHNLPNDRSFGTWGASFDWSVSDKISLIGEAFGLLFNNDPDRPHANDPRAQFAVRFKPTEDIDFDVIYGRNIFGENAHWITVGLNVRFNAFGERTAAAEPTPIRRPVIRK